MTQLIDFSGKSLELMYLNHILNLVSYALYLNNSKSAASL